MTFISGFVLVGAAYCESMAVFTLDDRRFGLPITVYSDILPMRRTELPCLLLQSKMLSACTCAASDLNQVLITPCTCTTAIEQLFATDLGLP